MSTNKKPNNNLPFLIIGIVAVFAVLGAIYFIKFREPEKKTASNTSNKSTAASTASAALAKAPAGAVPPNMLGSPTAAVVLEEFADYQCPTCATMHPVMKEVTAAYGSKIKFIYRSFPLIQIHDKAYDAAVAAEAAGIQGKFWDMQNQLFQNQKSWASSPEYKKLFEDYAKLIGLDVEKYKNDVAGLAAKSRVDADLTRARGAQVNSTPSLFINGNLVPFEQMNAQSLKQLIDAELQKFQAPPAENANK